MAVLQTATAPPAAIEVHSKESEWSNGIISMMNLLVKDLGKEMTEAEAAAEVAEKAAQEDYAVFMKDSADK